MKITKCRCFALFFLALSVGCFANNSNAQQSAYSDNYTGGDDSLVLIPYGQSGQTAMRRGYPPQPMSPYSRSDMMSGQSGYSQQFQNRSPYYSGQQSAPRRDQNALYDRRDQSALYDRRGRANYEMRREDFTYANAPALGYSQGERGQSGCSGGCSHERRSGYESPGYESNGQRSFDRGQPTYSSAADQAPQLSRYRSDPRNSAANSGARSRRLIQDRQENFYPQSRGGIGTTSQGTFSPLEAPPSSFGIPSSSGARGCGHAGCNHDHN